MATIWLTYAWEDNKAQDVDFVAQELTRAGLTVKLDRWNIGAGKRLWEQIESFIQDPARSEAWVLYATQASLGSEPCKEEFAYALDRALKTRGGTFPVIGLFPGPVDDSLIPAGIKTRLHVSTRDPDWKERIHSAADGRAPNVSRARIDPYEIVQHPAHNKWSFVLEVRPRAGTWAPFIACVPLSEQGKVQLHIQRGPRGRVTDGGVLTMVRTGTTSDGQWHFHGAGDEATPTLSYFLFMEEKPSRILFGVDSGSPQYVLDLGVGDGAT